MIHQLDRTGRCQVRDALVKCSTTPATAHYSLEIISETNDDVRL